MWVDCVSVVVCEAVLVAELVAETVNEVVALVAASKFSAAGAQNVWFVGLWQLGEHPNKTQSVFVTPQQAQRLSLVSYTTSGNGMSAVSCQLYLIASRGRTGSCTAMLVTCSAIVALVGACRGVKATRAVF